MVLASCRGLCGTSVTMRSCGDFPRRFIDPQTNPYAPRSDDGPGVAAWRQRMDSPQGKEIYRRRSLHECINARFRQWGLYRFTVRRAWKVATVLRWLALANNVLAAHRLLKAVA